MASTGRRGFLRIVAATAASGLCPGLARGRAQPWRWVGTALGARASITVHHRDRAESRRIVRACLAEVHRLEAVFSLYRADSALSRLNRDGALDSPPPELVTLLADALAYGDRTGGAFDVTVQPLWRLYRDHFAGATGPVAAPAEAALAAARRAVDRGAVQVARSRIRLARPGMALTFNGIAQGYITDRVAGLLQAAGLRNVLLDLGEIRAVGPRGGGAPWHVRLPETGGDDLLPLAGARAVATSTPDAFRFDAGGEHHHLLDPATGQSASRHAAVTVVAPTATRADALSTAFCLMREQEIRTVVARTSDLRVRVVDPAGGSRWIG